MIKNLCDLSNCYIILCSLLCWIKFCWFFLKLIKNFKNCVFRECDMEDIVQYCGSYCFAKPRLLEVIVCWNSLSVWFKDLATSKKRVPHHDTKREYRILNTTWNRIQHSTNFLKYAIICSAICIFQYRKWISLQRDTHVTNRFMYYLQQIRRVGVIPKELDVVQRAARNKTRKF